MTFMLDTNICVFIMNEHPDVMEQFRKQRHYGVCISSIVLSELEFGVYNSKYQQINRDKLNSLCALLAVLPIEISAAAEYGRIRADLTQRGRIIGALDMLIAAHAKSAGLTLVTNNTREFSRVIGLSIEDWLS
ncbi:MAG: type II toxin-antitoxin system VapC family toxin [Oscillospiraceae bacterium]|jgi:tRNA(fMet)-specific endonuclease VapC|nr:type II toxin-antitoxin system VapC family toxin [Oscillospiraceae bacterium]